MRRNHERRDSTVTCVVCCGEIEFYASGQCDHPICYVCCVRMRVLGREKYCAVCRTDLDKVFLTRNFGKWSLIQAQISKGHLDKDSGIIYADKEIRNNVKELLQLKCHLCPDQQPVKIFGNLRDHMKKQHQLYYCGICIEHLRKFTHEWKVYSRHDLAQHRRVGDSTDTSHRGHPLCVFCEERFLDDDELHSHLRKNHFWCHICEKDGKQIYFEDYINLKQHFGEGHFLCEEDACMYEQFTSVFRSEIDFQAHRASKHAQKMTKAEVRQARQVEVDIVFNKRPPQGRNVTGQDYDEIRTTDRRNQRPKGRGRDNDHNNRTEESNIQSAKEMSLHEAEQKKEPSPPITPQESPKESEYEQPHNFTGEFPTLSTSSQTNSKTNQSNSPKVSPKTTRKPEPYKRGSNINSLEDFPSLDGVVTHVNVQPQRAPPGFANRVKESFELAQPKPKGQPMKKASPPPRAKSEIQRPQKVVFENHQSNVNDNEKKETKTEAKTSLSRNQSFIVNVKNLLGHDMNKFQEFKTISGGFRKGSCTATEYYDHCTCLFGSNFVFIFNELVNLLPDPDKKMELLRIHNDSTAVAKQKGLPRQQNNIKRNPPTMAWVTSTNSRDKPAVKPANPVKPERSQQFQMSKQEVDFPSLPSAAPRQVKAIYRPTTSLNLKSAWVRGK